MIAPRHFKFPGLVGISFFLMVLIIAATGCEGPEGPTGEGVNTVDLRPPEISLIQPAPNDTLTAAFFTFEAEASDNDSLWYVEFFVDGSSDRGSDSGAAIVSDSPYVISWTFLGSGHGAGLHILTARAVDMSENVTWTPPIPVWLLPRFGLVELAYDLTAEYIGVMKLPDESGDRYWNVRFSPQAECTLVALYFVFADPSYHNLHGGIDMNIFVWSESVDMLPSGIPDSMDVTGEMIYNQWIEFDYSGRDTPITFSGDFHAGFSPVDSLYDAYLDSSDYRGALIFVSINETNMLKEPEKHRSIEYESGGEARGWGTVQEHYGIKYDFYIRAVVDYGDGVPTAIAPEGSNIAPDDHFPHSSELLHKP